MTEEELRDINLEESVIEALTVGSYYVTDIGKNRS